MPVFLLAKKTLKERNQLHLENGFSINMLIYAVAGFTEIQVAKLQNILSNAAAVAFDLGLKTLCVQCSNTISNTISYGISYGIG